MKDEYLKILYLETKPYSGDGRYNTFLDLLPKERGILYSIEYQDHIAYGISRGWRTTMKYHNLNGPAIIHKDKSLSYANEYFIYGKFMGFTTQMTFEEFKIRRDKLLKEITFK